MTSSVSPPITEFVNTFTLSSRKYWNTVLHDPEDQPFCWIEEPGSKAVQFSHGPIHVYRRATSGNTSNEGSGVPSSQRQEVATINFRRFGASTVTYHGNELMLKNLIQKKGFFASSLVSKTPIGDVKWSLKLFAPELYDASGTKLLTSANMALISTGTPRIEVSNLIDVMNPEVMDLIVVGWVVMMRLGERKRRHIVSAGAAGGS